MKVIPKSADDLSEMSFKKERKCNAISLQQCIGKKTRRSEKRTSRQLEGDIGG